MVATKVDANPILNHRHRRQRSHNLRNYGASHTSNLTRVAFPAAIFRQRSFQQATCHSVLHMFVTERKNIAGPVCKPYASSELLEGYVVNRNN